MDYSQLSDFVINVEVFEALHGGSPDYKEGDDGAMLLVSFEADVVGGDIVEVEVVRGSFNPCHNPADAWPIIFSNLISVEPDYEYIDPSEEECFASGLWISEYFDGKNKSLRYADPSPLRAAMIVFLKMQGPNNA